jgi:hypothetical protein
VAITTVILIMMRRLGILGRESLQSLLAIKTPNVPIETKLRGFLSGFYRIRVSIGILLGEFFQRVSINLLSSCVRIFGTGYKKVASLCPFFCDVTSLVIIGSLLSYCS